MAERGAKTATDSICDSIFRVTNMIRVGFINSKEKSVAITDPPHRLNDITYFTFRAKNNRHLVDTRAPDSIHLFEFSLRLSNIFPSSSVSFPIKISVQANTKPAPVDTFDSTLSKISDNYLQFMAAARIRELISTRHNTMTAYSHLGVSRTLQFTTPPPSTTVVALIKTPKMNIIYSFFPIGCTYTRSLDFLND